MHGRTCYMLAALVMGAALTLWSCSKADERMGEGVEEHREGMHEEDMGRHAEDEHGEAMVRRHESMMKLQQEWVKAKAALEKGEPGAAVEPAREMVEAAKAQEQFMLHGQGKDYGAFQQESRKFRALIMDFGQYAEKGDIRALKEIAPQIDAACNSCHQGFRG